MATKIRGRQIETDDFIKSVRNSDVDWTDDVNAASQKAIKEYIDSLSGNDKTFVYEWSNPLSTITISHNLNKFPSVTIVDTTGSEIVGDITYVNINTVTITFSAAARGIAYFN